MDLFENQLTNIHALLQTHIERTDVKDYSEMGVSLRHHGHYYLSSGSIPLPTDKQIYTLAGGYVATNTKDVAKLPDNLVKAANAWLGKAAEMAEPKDSKGGK